MTSPATLNVFAAASLTDVFGEIGEEFMAVHTGTKIVFNFAGSNQLATQIGQGAPADVFAAANDAQMTAAIESGRIRAEAVRPFATNQLVIAIPADNPANLHSLTDLAMPGVKIVLAAAEVPVGAYALAFLEKAAQDTALGVAYRDAVIANVVSYEVNVRAVLSKVRLGEADAGIVYMSDMRSHAGGVTQIEIPSRLNIGASYPIAPLVDSPNLQLAQRFMDFVLGLEGQQILDTYGFTAVRKVE